MDTNERKIAIVTKVSKASTTGVKGKQSSTIIHQQYNRG
jgi:hypothetical protein